MIPEIITILTIVSTILSSETFRTNLYESNLLDFYKKMSSFSTGKLSPHFILHEDESNQSDNDNDNDNDNGEEGDEDNGKKEEKKKAERLDRFHSIAQLHPLLNAITERVLKNMDIFSHFDIALISLSFLENLVFSSVDFYLRVRGEREVLDVNDMKSRDLHLIDAGEVIRTCDLRNVLEGMAESAKGVLEKEITGKKKGASELGAGIRMMIRIAVIYGKEPVSVLAMLVEVG